MNIIVNGGSRGIGREIVKQFAANEINRIIVTGRNMSLLEQLSQNHRNVVPLFLDLSAFDSSSAGFYEFVSSRFEDIDILINSAGLLISKKFEDFSADESRKIMETNFFGPASVIRVLKPLMKAGTHIINISSMGGFQGSSKYNGLSYYSASKAAIACLTECLAGEFKDTGIKVNCLALGSVQTEMLNEAFPGYVAPVTAEEMGKFISDFALNGHKVFNGKILPVAVTNP